MDTNVFIGALIGRDGHNRRMIRACLEEAVRPVMSHSLFQEHLAVLGRDELFAKSPLDRSERQELLEAYLSFCEWVRVYYSWRPNLPDEADNHVMELAIAGRADAIVSNNLSDFTGGQLRFPQIRVLKPADFLKEMS